MLREIGSEFWEYLAPEIYVHNLPDWLKWGNYNRLFVSGRTALAQINGRNGLDWETKFNYDIKYVDQMSFLLDIKTMYKTLSKVLNSENVGIIGIDVIENFDTFRIQQRKSSGE